MRKRYIILFGLTLVLSLSQGRGYTETDYLKESAEIYEQVATAKEEAAAIRKEIGEYDTARELFESAADAWKKSYDIWKQTGEPQKAENAKKHYETLLKSLQKKKIRIKPMGFGSYSTVVNKNVIISARLIDRNRTPVAGEAVKFTVISKPAKETETRIADARVISDVDGIVKTEISLGKKAGIYEIEAALEETPDIKTVVTITARPGRPKIIQQVSPPEQETDRYRKSSPFVIRVLDEYENPIIGAGVSFEIISTPPEPGNISLSETTTTSGINGEASATLSLSGVMGDYVIEAGLLGSPVRSRVQFVVHSIIGIPTFTIRSIKIEGQTDIPERVFLEALKINTGDEIYTKNLNRTIQKSIHALYELNMLDDIKASVSKEDNQLDITFSIKMRKRIRDIIFKGNKRFKRGELMEELSISEGQFYSKAGLIEGENKLVEFYKKKGFKFVKIESSVSPTPDEREMVINFDFNEGHKIKIKKMRVHGNKAISNLLLAWHMKTGWGRIYDKEVFNKDREKVRYLYNQRGYVGVQISDPVITYSKKKKGMILDIYIKEGEKFYMGDVSFKGNEALTGKELRSYMPLKKGDVFDLPKVYKSVQKLYDVYAAKGYIFATIIPGQSIDEENNQISMEFKITEDIPATIEKIEIEGNTKTKLKVITREFLFKEGDKFNGDRVKMTEQSLNNLGFFDEVSITQTPGSERGKQVVKIKVKEGKTGSANFGAGYSSTTKFTGFLQVNKKNFDITDLWSFTGAGQSLSVRAEWGGRTKSYNLSWSDPWFLDKRLFFGFSLFDNFYNDNVASYDQEKQGISANIGKRIGHYNNLNFGYTIEKDRIFGITEKTDLLTKEEIGYPGSTSRTSTLSTLSTSLTRDTRNNYAYATRGYRLAASNKLVGGFLGGNTDYNKLVLEGRFYYNVTRKQVLAFRSQYGRLDNPFGSASTPNFERFKLGGLDNVRGYGDDQIRLYNEAGVPLGGGQSEYFFNTEYRIPLIERQVTGIAFFDGGNVWEGKGDFKLSDMRYGVGAGLRVKTPMGPVKIDYAYALSPVNKAGGTGVGETKLHFGIGNSF